MHSFHSPLNGVSWRHRSFYSAVVLGLSLLCTSSAGLGTAINSAGSVVARLPLVVQSATAGCTTSKPISGAYSVTVCITNPAIGAALTGNATVTATVSTTGSSVQRVLFYLDGSYLLTDYSSSYSFVLPTKQWVDGSHTLAASAAMRDGFVSARASRGVAFNNGVINPPPNPTGFKPTSGRAANGAPFIVAATGDGASGEPNAVKVSSMLKSINPNLLLYLGDVYEEGSVAEFYNWYGNSSNFGALRSVTDPTVGNHEYLTSGAKGYFNYWKSPPQYYSFNANGWHFVSLNSNGSFSSLAAGSAQYNWLQSDLAAQPANMCIIAFYHHPYFNIGPEGSTSQMSAIWSLMATDGVDIVLNGHDHDYQRWKPLSGSGAISSKGITEFVVGTGGHGLQTFTKSDSRVAYKNDANPTAFGALLLTLQSGKATFKYQNISGTVLDSGTIPCVTASSGATPTPTATKLASPTPPKPAATPTSTPASSSLTFMPAADAYVDAANPSNNYGGSAVLRADASPDQHDYLRFSVSGLGGLPIKRVRLLVYANSSTVSSLAAKAVSSTTWGETTVTYSNMPALGSTIVTVASASSGTWIAFDVTSYVKAAGTYSVGITTSGSTSVSLAAREAGAHAPKLIVDLGP